MNISITATINLEGAGGKQNCSCIKFDEREKKRMGIISSHYWTCCRTFWFTTPSIILILPIIHFLNYSVDIQINKCNVSGTCNKWDWNLRNSITLRRKCVCKGRLEHQFWRMQGRERTRCKRRPWPQIQWQKKQTTYRQKTRPPGSRQSTLEIPSHSQWRNERVES